MCYWILSAYLKDFYLHIHKDIGPQFYSCDDFVLVCYVTIILGFQNKLECFCVFNFGKKSTEELTSLFSLKIWWISPVKLFNIFLKVTQLCPTLVTPWTEQWSGQPFPSPGDLPNPGTVPRLPALQVDFLPADPEYWSGQPIPSPADLPGPGIELGSPALQADSLPTELSGCIQSECFPKLLWLILFCYILSVWLFICDTVRLIC